MAKQKKQKKTGMAKRKKEKLDKKRVLKRKVHAQKKPEPKRLSMSKVKKNLKNLPLLIFEPELQEIAFSAEDVKKAQSEHEKLPDQIESVATGDFQEKLKEKFIALKEKFDASGDVNKGMMVSAMQYYMDQEHSPTFMNQIIVGMYLNAVTKLENPETAITLDLLNIQLKEYDKNWASYLEDRMAEFDDKVKDAASNDDSLNSAVEESPMLPETPFETVLNDFISYLGDQDNLDDETKERTQEDIEVLLNDYGEDKEISEFETLIKLRKIKNFIESWFIRMMHPTSEDLGNMVDSLLLFFNYLQEKESQYKETSDEVIAFLSDKDAILSKLTI
jgi:hypothetical protein